MSIAEIREQLHKEIENLPDDVVVQIADFTMFVMARRKIRPGYDDWQGTMWQDFILQQFFREEDEVEYTLKDAQEIYNP